MVGIACGWTLLAALALAQPERPAAAVRLMRQGKRHQDGVKELWKEFVFTPREVTDAELDELIRAYEKAIDAYQSALEVSQSDAGYNAAILVLAKRVAQLRMVEMGRALQSRPPPERPPPERPPAPPPPESGASRPPPAPEPQAAPPDVPVLPELVEPRRRRARGLRDLRNFLMNHYLPPRKFDSMVDRCTRCNGRGKIPTGRLTKQRRPEMVGCPACRGAGHRLDATKARKGYWLCWSPLYRSDPNNRQRWSATLAAWRDDPREVPEFLTTLRIGKIDYHGLWAEVAWEEKGVTKERRRFRREVRRKLIRAGRRWFFFDESCDREFFRPEEPAAGVPGAD